MDARTKEQEELRDKFAAAALTTLLHHIATTSAFAAQPDKHRDDAAHERLAAEAYRWADAMLKVRDQS